MPLRCTRPFLPGKLQPQPRCTYFGASSIPSQCNFNDDPITGRQSFRYVQAPMVVSPPGCTYHASSTLCGQPGRLHHAMNWKLPSRTVVSLHDRIGQLSWRVFLSAGLQPCRLLPATTGFMLRQAQHEREDLQCLYNYGPINKYLLDKAGFKAPAISNGVYFRFPSLIIS
jgi:hypothetical protein